MPDLQDMGAEAIQSMIDLARAHDPDTLVIAVLHGSEERGLALSMWTVFEGEDSREAATRLLVHALLAKDVREGREE